MMPIELTFDPGTGASRFYELYAMGGVVSGTPGAPVTVTCYTEAAAQFTA